MFSGEKLSPSELKRANLSPCSFFPRSWHYMATSSRPFPSHPTATTTTSPGSRFKTFPLNIDILWVLRHPSIYDPIPLFSVRGAHFLPVVVCQPPPSKYKFKKINIESVPWTTRNRIIGKYSNYSGLILGIAVETVESSGHPTKMGRMCSEWWLWIDTIAGWLLSDAGKQAAPRNKRNKVADNSKYSWKKIFKVLGLMQNICVHTRLRTLQ